MDNLHQLFPFLIPIVAIIMGIGIAMLGLVLDFRKKREIYALHHKERLVAIEKGLEVPPLPSEFFEDGRRGRRSEPLRALRTGLVWLFVGVAVTVALYATHSDDMKWVWGLVPTAVGLAKLLYFKLSGGAAVPGPGSPPPGAP
jgi:hypothetical protein